MNPDGCSNYVVERGQGPPVIVVHGGFGAEHSYLVDAFRELEAEHRFVFYDQRGSLRSPFRVFEKGGSEACPDSLITLANHVADLERLRQQLGVERLAIVAHSMGALIALSYLERFPQHVGPLVLLSPGIPLRPVRDSQALAAQRRAVNALFDNPQIAVEAKRAGVDHPPLSDKQRIDEWRIRYAAANIYDVSRWRELGGGMAFYNPRASVATNRTVPKDYDFLPILRQRSCQTSIILGDHDSADMGATTIQRQADGVQAIALTIVPNAGHALWIDQRERFRQAVSHALRGCAQ